MNATKINTANAQTLSIDGFSLLDKVQTILGDRMSIIQFARDTRRGKVSTALLYNEETGAAYWAGTDVIERA